jgi:hypothetical protein
MHSDDDHDHDDDGDDDDGDDDDRRADVEVMGISSLPTR